MNQQRSIDAAVDAAISARDEIFAHVGYVEDWCVFPLDDSRNMFWAVDERERCWVKYSPNRDALVYWLSNDGDFGPHRGLYENSIYTQRFLPKWVYRGDELTMVVADTQTDGNKCLQLFRTENEVLLGK